MSKSYTKKTLRSRRKMNRFNPDQMQVKVADGKASFQMVLPMGDLMLNVAAAIEQTASQAGVLMMKSLIDDEVEQLAGQRYAHQSNRSGYRWGKEDGHVIFAGRKVGIEKPRLRSRDGQELPLSRYQAFSNPRRLEQSVSQKILRRVSSRDYAGALDNLCDGYGIQKSSVSRKYKAASALRLEQLMQRRLDGMELTAIYLDGKEFADFTLITALGVDTEGRKHVLGLWPGATENAEVCGRLLEDLLERGLRIDWRYLFVLDGSKALKKAVVQRFGSQTLIQRCQIHKQRNVEGHLPDSQKVLFRMKYHAALGMEDYTQARQELEKVHRWLMGISEAAARSLEEGMEELLTVHRLKLPYELRKTLDNTNLIESCFSVTSGMCRNVKRWRNESMACRWMGAALLEAEKHFHRVRGYRQIPLLQKALNQEIDKKIDVV
jgi:transposase-like protein